jgi:hypothetical protein
MPISGDAEADCIRLWTHHTWALEAAETTPYLPVRAPTPKAGNSRVVDVAQHPVRRPEGRARSVAGQTSFG